MSALEQAAPLLRLDLGAGKNRRDGFTSVDIRPFDGVDIVADLSKPWPWDNDSVSEVNASHFIEHLDGPERVHFVNELHRVLVNGGKATVVTPHWASTRAYGDLTHKWPPVSEFWFYYLDKGWREANAPHNDGYACDFSATWGYSMRPEIMLRNQEFQQFAMTWYAEARQDMIATLIKK